MVDRMLGLLRAAGFSDVAAWHAMSVTTDYVFGFTLLEILRALQAEAAGGGTAEYLAFLRRLPVDVYPNLVAVAPHLGTEDERVEYGIRAVVTGARSRGAPT